MRGLAGRRASVATPKVAHVRHVVVELMRGWRFGRWCRFAGLGLLAPFQRLTLLLLQHGGALLDARPRRALEQDFETPPEGFPLDEAQRFEVGQVRISAIVDGISG